MRVIFVCLFLLALTPAFAQGKLGVAAVVNDDVITTLDIDGRVNLAIQSMGMKPDDAMLKQLRHQATDTLIEEQIRTQEASRLGVLPTPNETSDAFNKIAAQNNFSPEQFKQIVQSAPGAYDSLLHQIKAQMAWGNVIKKKIRPQINVTENDISTYLADKAKNPAKVEYQVAEIFLKNNETNKTLANQIVKELQGGKHFSAVARQFSQGMEASKGGLLGWIPEHTLEPALDTAIGVTPQGNITTPIISNRGIHIFMVLGKRDILPAAEISQRLHLKQLVVPVPSDATPDVDNGAKQTAATYMAQATDCTAIDTIIQKINSPLSKDVGEVRLADMPAAAISAIKDLPNNKASQPLRASDGYIVFMICGRSDNSSDAMRDDIANIIGTERLNRMQNRYYRDLRATAYVDIKQN